MENPECDYCETEAVSLEILSMHSAEGLLDYEYYVCQDHRGVKHHEMEAVEMWQKKRGLI
jgi:hypothetical protein